jgi:HEAT repeat protein
VFRQDVKPRRWLAAILFSAATAALSARPVMAQPATGGESTAEVARQEFDQLRQTLTDPDKSSRERDEAARRLLERGANEVLLDALRSGRGDFQAPVARALAETKNPPEVFLDDLLRCLQPQISGELAEAASLAAANYRDSAAARSKLRDFILSANIPEPRRIPAVRALGTLNDKDTAAFLMTVLRGTDARISQQLSDAAADALGDMTGLTEFGRDVGQWDRWWRGQQNKSPEQFLNERRAEREGSARQAIERLKIAAQSIDRMVEDHHRPITDPQLRDADLLGYLNDPSPEFRAAGARLVNQDLNAGLPIASSVKERLRDLIGDSSPDVRRRVAFALAAVNDPRAAKSLLAQLQREKIEPVKAALMQALAPTMNIAAVPDLVRLLDDPAFQVSEAAAAALRELGPEIAKSPELERTVANALQGTIERTTNVRGADRLREYVTEAMIPLKDISLVQVLFTLVSDRVGNNTPNTRNSALRALAAMDAPPKLQADIAGRIAESPLSDGEKGVRLEAAKALGIVGGPAQAEALYKAMGKDEPDEAVREAAWKSLSSLFDQFSVNDLLAWSSQRFANSPDHRLSAYLALNKKLIPQGAPAAETLAFVQQEIGALYLDPKIDKPDQAVPYLLGALNYWSGRAGGGVVNVNTLQDLSIRAYLRSKQYKEAVQFAAGQIQKNAQNTDAMGGAILQEVNRLNRANQLQDALALLTEAKTLPIKGFYQDQFMDLVKDIKARIVPLLWGYDWWMVVDA